MIKIVAGFREAEKCSCIFSTPAFHGGRELAPTFGMLADLSGLEGTPTINPYAKLGKFLTSPA